MRSAALLLLLLPSLSPHYGFYSDELYYLACARRPAFGYVDHPPLFVWLLGAYAWLLLLTPLRGDLRTPWLSASPRRASSCPCWRRRRSPGTPSTTGRRAAAGGRRSAPT